MFLSNSYHCHISRPAIECGPQREAHAHVRASAVHLVILQVPLRAVPRFILSLVALIKTG